MGTVILDLYQYVFLGSQSREFSSSEYCMCTHARKPKEAHMATCCHFFAVGQLYGFSGFISQSGVSGSDTGVFSLWALPPFSILSTAKSSSAPDPDTLLSSSGDVDSSETPPLSLSGSNFVMVSSILGNKELYGSRN